MIVDVSQWQGTIDWNKAKGSLDFCIIRAYGVYGEDGKYRRNAEACKELGIPFHVYCFLTASNEATAREQANGFYRTASDDKPVSWVVDVEDKNIPVANAANIVSAFIAELRRLGAKCVGIYTGEWAYGQYNLRVDEADWVWIARYGGNSGEPETEPTRPCDLWQYTSKGQLPGIQGDVDLNKLTGRKP